MSWDDPIVAQGAGLFAGRLAYTHRACAGRRKLYQVSNSHPKTRFGNRFHCGLRHDFPAAFGRIRRLLAPRPDLPPPGPRISGLFSAWRAGFACRVCQHYRGCVPNPAVRSFLHGPVRSQIVDANCSQWQRAGGPCPGSVPGGIAAFTLKYTRVQSVNRANAGALNRLIAAIPGCKVIREKQMGTFG